VNFGAVNFINVFREIIFSLGLDGNLATMKFKCLELEILFGDQANFGKAIIHFWCQ
jgi:hypothetical protein